MIVQIAEYQFLVATALSLGAGVYVLFPLFSRTARKTTAHQTPNSSLSSPDLTAPSTDALRSILEEYLSVEQSYDLGTINADEWQQKRVQLEDLYVQKALELNQNAVSLQDQSP